MVCLVLWGCVIWSGAGDDTVIVVERWMCLCISWEVIVSCMIWCRRGEEHAVETGRVPSSHSTTAGSEPARVPELVFGSAPDEQQVDIPGEFEASSSLHAGHHEEHCPSRRVWRLQSRREIGGGIRNDDDVDTETAEVAVPDTAARG